MEQSTALPETREFSKLVGEWDASIVRRNRDGSWPDEPTRALWRWYLILDGSAIQDDWISLTDAGPGEEPIQRFEGTNIRIYHPEEALWHMAWIDRTNRKLATFTATDENGTVTMTGQNAQGRLVRITFSDITETTFNWQQEWTTDGGTNWFAVATMNCTRRK